MNEQIRIITNDRHGGVVAVSRGFYNRALSKDRAFSEAASLKTIDNDLVRIASTRRAVEHLRLTSKAILAQPEEYISHLSEAANLFVACTASLEAESAPVLS